MLLLAKPFRENIDFLARLPEKRIRPRGGEGSGSLLDRLCERG
jgi:hypothetical protein